MKKAKTASAAKEAEFKEFQEKIKVNADKLKKARKDLKSLQEEHAKDSNTDEQRSAIQVKIDAANTAIDTMAENDRKARETVNKVIEEKKKVEAAQREKRKNQSFADDIKMSEGDIAFYTNSIEKLTAEYNDAVARTDSMTVDTEEFMDAKHKEDRKKQLLDKITMLLTESHTYLKRIQGYVNSGKAAVEAAKNEEMAKEAQEKAKKTDDQLKKLKAELAVATTKANSKNARDKKAGEEAKNALEAKILKAEELKTIADGELEDRNKTFSDASKDGVEKDDARLVVL